MGGSVRKPGLIAVIVLAALWIGPATAEAAKPPLGFADQAALSVSCAELVEGRSVAIRNETASKRRVRLAVSGLENSDGRSVRLRQVCGGLRIGLPVKVLKPGRSTKATVRAVKSGPQTYTGSLTLFARFGRVARRELEISPTPEAGLSTPPLLASQSAKRQKWDPFDGGLVWVPVGLASDEVQLPPEASDGTRSMTVGALVGTEGTIPVTYEGEIEELTATTSLVGLELGGYEPGSYSGKVDLMPGAEGGDLALDLKVTTWWPIPALVLLLGIVGGVLLQRQSGRRGPRARLLQRIADLEQRHGDAVAKLRLAAGGPPGGGGGPNKPWGDFSIAQLAQAQEQLREQVERSTEKAWVKIDEKVLSDLEARIAMVEAQIDLLGMVPDLARELEGALNQLAAGPSSPLPPRRGSDAGETNPGLDAEARQALVGASTGRAELQGKLDAIRSRAAAVRNLHELEERLSDLWRGKKELDRARVLTAEEKTELDRELIAVHHLLWESETDRDLEQAHEQLQAAAAKIAGLWAKLPEEQLPQLARIRHIGFGMELEAAEPLVLPAPGTVAEGPLLPNQTDAAPTASLPQLSVEEATEQISQARFGQLLLVLVTGAVALASGLAVLYVGKEWGSPWDYLAALVWGLAAQTLVLSLATSINEVGALTARRSHR